MTQSIKKNLFISFWVAMEIPITPCVISVYRLSSASNGSRRILPEEHDVNIFKKLEKHLLKDSSDPACKVFQRLAKSLCSEGDFKLAEIYDLAPTSVWPAEMRF